MLLGAAQWQNRANIALQVLLNLHPVAVAYAHREVYSGHSFFCWQQHNVNVDTAYCLNRLRRDTRHADLA